MASRARAWGDLILPGSMRAGPAPCVLGQCLCSALFPCVPHCLCFHKCHGLSHSRLAFRVSNAHTTAFCCHSTPSGSKATMPHSLLGARNTARLWGRGQPCCSHCSEGTSDCVVDSNHSVNEQMHHRTLTHMPRCSRCAKQVDKMALRGSGQVEPWEQQIGEVWWEDLADMAHLTEETLLSELTRQYQGESVCPRLSARHTPMWRPHCVVPPPTLSTWPSLCARCKQHLSPVI